MQIFFLSDRPEADMQGQDPPGVMQMALGYANAQTQKVLCQSTNTDVCLIVPVETHYSYMGSHMTPKSKACVIIMMFVSQRCTSLLILKMLQGNKH